MKRAVILLVLVVAAAIGGGARAAAAEPGWHSEQPVAAGIEVPVPLGKVGDIQCWQANRCVLITGGNGGMPAGIYAYDGVGWHLYSTVCGGAEGRIAWAGPDEFWTVADQREGEEAPIGGGRLSSRSLCRFANGEVVASYAEPIGQATSFSKMDAAACDGPDDCWFGGERLGTEAANVGGFHLHWDGSTLAAVPSLTATEAGLEDPGRSVVGLAFSQGQLYESVAVRAGDQATPGETEPSLVHRVALGAAKPFEPLTVTGLAPGTAQALEGFHLASDGSTVWGLSGTVSSSSSVQPTMMRLEGGALVQLPLTGSPIGPGDAIAGFAVEPGGAGAWASFTLPARENEGPARLVRIEADGDVGAELQLPRTAEELDEQGPAGPIACPAAGQCWMATGKGWLYHLGGAPVEGPDTDPAMHQLITFRPCDEACRSSTEVGLPQDDSGAEPEVELFPDTEPYEPLPARPGKRHPLYTHLRQKLVDETVLQLTFILHARAHVQLIAKEHKRVVAKTARFTFGKGPHLIRLRLDPKHWPTHLSFQVHRIKTKRTSR